MLTCFSPQMAFSSRVRVYHAWQNAEAELRRLKQTHERNRAQGKVANDRLGHSYSQIGEVRPSFPAVSATDFLLSLSNGYCALHVGGAAGAGCEARI